MAKNFISLYVHLPFCRKRCAYCDFVSYSDKLELVETYFEALKEELMLYESVLSERVVNTVYFGGGTPSLLNPQYIVVFLEFLKEVFTLASKAEVTLEANPESVSSEKLRMWRKAGVNRLSLGFQSLNPEQLKILGRIHNVEKSIEAYLLAREAGFRNINIDLLFGLPGEPQQKWEETLKKAVALSPEHFSLYELTLEPATPLYRKVSTELNIFFEEDYDVGLDDNEIRFFRKEREVSNLKKYLFAFSFLKSADYLHYEVSNYARSGFECRHNLNYWKRGEFLGLGCAADSFLGCYRWQNFTSIERYLKAVFRGIKPFEESYFISSKEALREKLFQGLRLLEGLEIEDIVGGLKKEKKESFKSELSKLEKLGLLKLEENKFTLTTAGLLVSNRIYTKLLASIES